MHTFYVNNIIYKSPDIKNNYVIPSFMQGLNLLNLLIFLSPEVFSQQYIISKRKKNAFILESLIYLRI